MAESGGYWLNLAEAQKLSQTHLVPGIVEENVRRGGILDRFPLAQPTGTSITWNRENAEREGKEVGVGAQLKWSNDITYTQISTELKIIYDQTPLDKFVASVYGTFNNYEATMLRGMKKGMWRRAEDRIIYGDTSFSTGSLQFDGLHAWAYDNGVKGSSNMDIDEAGPLSLANLRLLEDEMKLGTDFILMPYTIARRIDAFYQEVGSTVSNRSAIGSFLWDTNAIGKRVPFWNGIEIVRSDYMVAEQAGTGEGSDAMAKYTSGTQEYSIFMVKLGQVMEGEGGMTLGFGGDTHQGGEIFRTTFFPALEDYDASGLRLTSYIGMLAGSTFSVGRIYGITDAAITE